ncbi:MarR family winged helix-turn-helix transcriptional regulator [Basfia succiniciproducens]|uniref:DNA-binding transcriptional regulator, MarR family n=1 Tax=Basfia succiniciproducens TaxID=653940 RepID=A0A1G5CX94_9PAST|nr:MarR family transcriptional regulator [Basfia succiniciproducens]SCY07026.1 DNA-binding transcriptional regulator, MarR family [Basfia succiniciproducens]SCY25170.1 DNA-binding transcriptional regulator, MarR family [Basfia succiniciproducens]
MQNHITSIDLLAETMMQSLQIYMKYARKMGLAENEYVVLYSVYHHQGCSQKDIVADWELPKQTVSFVCKQLVERGWLAFVPDPNDKRGKLMNLTADGFAVIAPIIEAQTAAEQQSAVEFGEEKLATLVQDLIRLNKVLSKNLGVE